MQGRFWLNRRILPALNAFLIVTCLTLFIFLSAIHDSNNDKGLRFSHIESIQEEDKLHWSIMYDNKTFELPLIFSPLYTKINATRLMGNVTRANIYELVITNPGIHFSSITRELRISKGTAQYHLRVLERYDYIVSRKTGRQTRYYPVGMESSTLSEVQERIVRVIEEKPGISQIDIAKHLDISRQLVNYHVKKLVNKGIIQIYIESGISSCFSTEVEIN